MNGPFKPEPVNDRAPSEPGAGFSLDEAHVGIAVLWDYRAHRLSPEAEARIGEHLLRCADCRELAVDVNDFFDPAEEGEPEPLADPAAAWDGVRSSLAAEGWFTSQGGLRRRRVVRSLVILAACLAVAILGLDRYRMMGAQVQILVPVGAYKGPQEPTVHVRLPAIIKLTLSSTAGFGSYQIRIADGEWTRSSYRGLRPDREGRLELSLPKWSLSPGKYRLFVREGKGRAATLVDVYSFEIASR